MEQSLVEHVERGEWLDLAAEDEAVDEAAMRSWGESRTCRASVIRDILRGRLVADPDPHGLRLRGARITGRLDMDNLTTDVNLELKDCLLEEGLLAQEAHLASVALTGCQIEHSAEPPLAGDGLTCSVLALDGTRVIGHSDDGAVRLTGACISGPLTCCGAKLRNDAGSALYADSLQVGHIMDLRGGFTATGNGSDSTVNLRGANISGQLTCSGAELRNRSGPALNADNLKVDQDVYLRGGFTATGSGDDGAIRLLGAHIGGTLECDGAELRNDSGPALKADSLQVDQDMYLRGGFTASGSGGGGAVRLTSAHIGGQFVCDEAHLRNDSGPALSADTLQVGQDMFLTGGFTGSGGGGAVRLHGAHIGGQLDCTGAQLRNGSGTALAAENLQVGQDVFLRGRFTGTGGGQDGAVDLTGAHIGGQLDCIGAQLCNGSGTALAAENLQVGEDMALTGGFTATGGGMGVTLDLISAQVGGAFVFAPARLEHRDDSRRWVAVDGLTYSGVPQPISPQGWRELLRRGTPGYTAQPYQQLAAGYRAMGDEQQSRVTLMAQRDDQLARAGTSWPERLWGRITEFTLGYGYKPWRALWFLAAVVTASCVLAVALGAHGALAQTSKTATPGRSCTVVQQVSVGLDLNLPVGTSVARAGCDLTRDSASVTAAWLTAVGWVLRVLAWTFAALFVAGFTSAVRKT